jgi:threonylcarbamoyladenosine tRNA methylthiotransferase MtaB
MNTVDRLRKACPDFSFTTDIIVGFPGESEADFAETLEVMREVNFAKVHMFPYSERPRTKSATFVDKVPQDVIMRRKQQLLRMAEVISFDLRQQYVGRRMTVLTEARDSQGMLTGHTENFLQVQIANDTIPPNTLVEVDLLENTPTGLIGKIVEQKVCCG